MQLQRYRDIMADVRHDGDFHSITHLVQPNDLEVKEVAKVLHEAPNFITACQEFVNSFTDYKKEVGDYWATPAEIIERRAGDCDDKAILLVSLLRNYIEAEKVFCAFGYWSQNGSQDGHMWVVMEGEGENDRIIEATAGPTTGLRGNYKLEAIFNDVYAFAYPTGIKNFNLLPVAWKQPVEA
jgi:hypothetical protein